MTFHLQTPLSPQSQKLLSLLKSNKIRVDPDGTLNVSDLHIFLQQFVGGIQFTGQSSATTLHWGPTATSFKLATWTPQNYPGTPYSEAMRFLSRIMVSIDNPQAAGEPGNWTYVFDINCGYANSSNSKSITMQSACIPSNATATAISTFDLNLYSDLHMEFGFNYSGLASAPLVNICIYSNAPTPLDSYIGNANGALNNYVIPIIPTLNTVADAPLTASPSATLSIAVNNGTAAGWYSWATTSDASGGTTHGFV